MKTRILKFIISYKDTIKKALKLWGSVLFLLILFYILGTFGFYFFLIGLVTLGFIAFGTFIYLDFGESLQDDTFRLVFDSLNKLDKIFNKNLTYKKDIFAEEPVIMKNPYFEFIPRDTFTSHSFLEKEKKCTYHFYKIKDDNNYGLVIDIRLNQDVIEGKGLFIYNKAISPKQMNILGVNFPQLKEIQKWEIRNEQGFNSDLLTDKFFREVEQLPLIDKRRIHYLYMTNKKAIFYIDKLNPLEVATNEDLSNNDKRALLLMEIKKIRNIVHKVGDIYELYVDLQNEEDTSNL